MRRRTVWKKLLEAGELRHEREDQGRAREDEGTTFVLNRGLLVGQEPEETGVDVGDVGDVDFHGVTLEVCDVLKSAHHHRVNRGVQLTDQPKTSSGRLERCDYLGVHRHHDPGDGHSRRFSTYFAWLEGIRLRIAAGPSLGVEEGPSSSQMKA